MRKVLSAYSAGVIAIILLSGPLLAQTRDFDAANVTCDEVNTEDEAQTVVIWLDGYLAAKTNDTVTGMRWLEALYAHVEAECKKDLGKKILTIIEQMRR